MLTTAYISGPQMGVPVELLVDIGSTYTIISRSVIESIGLSVAGVQEVRLVITGSREERLSIVRLERLNCLGQSLQNFPVLVHTFPRRVERYIAGLLGMDFMKQFPIEIRTQSYEIVVR